MQAAQNPLPHAFVSAFVLLCLTAVLMGCGGSGAAAISPTSAPVLSLSAGTLAFAATGVGGSSASQTLTLTNTGNASLTLSSVTLSDTANYKVTNNCAGSLSPAAVCNLALIFTPQSAGTLAATLSISSNATPATQTVTLSGTASAAPNLTLSAAALNFGSVAVSSSSSPQTVTLSNTGSAVLSFSGIVLNDTSNYKLSNACGGSLAAGASCILTITFTPQSGASLPASVTLTDTAATSPQTITLSGTGVQARASLSATSVSFPNTVTGSSSAAQTVTLTNSGTATLAINSISLTGTNVSAFSESNNCGSTLSVSASCTITLSFTPPAAQTYTAAVTISDSAPNSPQSVALSGTGTASAITRTFYIFPASFPDTTPDTSVNALYTLVNNAQTSIDMTMYELVDTTFSGDLVAACNRGVKVRVLLDASLEKSANTAAYTQLNTAGANCSAVFSNTAFQATHQKSILIDGVTSVIMSLNLTSRYYSTTRDFALVENDRADYAAIEATFNSDYAAGTPYNGTQGASDFSYSPGLGDDLIWSPTTAQAAMLALINNAKSTLLIENEELSSSTSGTIVAALANACQNGVQVHFTIVDQSSYEAQFTTLKNAGCSVRTYPNTTTGFYVHAKAVVADYGLSTQNVYMGSINYSSASMNQNRELGLYISDAAAVQGIYSTMTSDYNGGTAW